MQDCPQNNIHRNCPLIVDRGSFENKAADGNSSDNNNNNENNTMQMRYYGFEDLEESPFDEPPLSAEIDLDRMVEALQKGAPPSEVFRNFTEDISLSSPRPHDEPRRSPQRKRQQQRRSSAQWNRHRQNNKPTGKRISFANKLVDVVPEQIGVKPSMSSLASHDFEDETYASFLSFENSLEYLLQGEWIQKEVDDLISPIKCTSSSKRRKSTAKGKEDDGVCSHWGDCLGLLSPTDYSSKPFSVPFKWKEYTTLDAECFDVELCRNDDSWVNSDSPRQRLRTSRSVCTDDDDFDPGEEESLTTARNSLSNSFKEMLPPLESLQNIFGRFFSGSSDGAKKQTGQKIKTRGDDETMSKYAEVSTIANTSVGLRVSATAE